MTEWISETKNVLTRREFVRHCRLTDCKIRLSKINASQAVDERNIGDRRTKYALSCQVESSLALNVHATKLKHLLLVGRLKRGEKRVHPDQMNVLESGSKGHCRVIEMRFCAAAELSRDVINSYGPVLT